MTIVQPKQRDESLETLQSELCDRFMQVLEDMEISRENVTN